MSKRKYTGRIRLTPQKAVWASGVSGIILKTMKIKTLNNKTAPETAPDSARQRPKHKMWNGSVSGGIGRKKGLARN